MAHTTSSSEAGGLFDRLNGGLAKKAGGGRLAAAALTEVSPITIEDLRDAAQLAIQVEFATIPVYLTGLYSIADKDSQAYQHLRGVVMEEMYHVNQAANILVGLGGSPKFTGTYAPSYPGYLPRANPDSTPFLTLNRASKDVFGDVFAAIETPAAYGAPAQGDSYDTIAQLYEALRNGIEAYEGNPFSDDGPGLQREDIYLGKFGGKVIKVIDKDSAYKAINEIVKQGEGTVPANAPMIPIEAHGAYNHYGRRTDGTYGPILGTPYELSHFMKFREVAMDPAPFPETYPILSNPALSDFSNPDALKLATVFNQHYGVLLHALETTFVRDPAAGAADAYFGTAMSMMHEVLPNLARALMVTPVNAKSNASVGPNAAPTWSHTDAVPVSTLKDSLDSALQDIMGKGRDLTVEMRETLVPCLRRARAGLDQATEGAGANHHH